MSEATVIGILITILFLSEVIRALTKYVHRAMKERDEIDQRLRNICRS